MSFAYSTIIARPYSIPFAVPIVVSNSANDLSAYSSAQTRKRTREGRLKSVDKLFTAVGEVFFRVSNRSHVTPCWNLAM